MPKSIINPENVFYPEEFSINKEDSSSEIKLYEVSIRDIMAIIAIGSPVYKFKDFDIVYFPIYLMKPNKLFFTIGLYELHIPTLDPLKPVVDELLHNSTRSPPLPIIYSSVTSAVIKRLGITKNSLEISNNVNFTSNVNELEQANPNTVTGNNQLQEQTRQLRTTSWVSAFLNTPGYDIVKNEGGGDCLFAVLRDGMKSMGVNKSVSELRKMLADSITDEVYETHKANYDAHAMEINDLKQQKKDLSEQMVQIRDEAKTIPKSERGPLVEQMNTIKSRAISVNNELKTATTAFKIDFGYMSRVSTIDDMKKAVKKSSFWADAWAIVTMEQLLNIKLIILSSIEYNNKQLDNVITCGNSINATTFSPNFYIITDYSGNHYELVTHNQKSAFSFDKLPNELVTVISQTCLKGESGAYNIIPEFNRLK
jgi:hypothetical protein